MERLSIFVHLHLGAYSFDALPLSSVWIVLCFCFHVLSFYLLVEFILLPPTLLPRGGQPLLGNSARDLLSQNAPRKRSISRYHRQPSAIRRFHYLRSYGCLSPSA